MGGKRTLDGIRLENILSVAGQIGATVREGTKHPYILNYEGLGACPVATSTHARRMVTPWMAKATGYTSSQIYEALRKGYLS